MEVKPPNDDELPSYDDAGSSSAAPIPETLKPTTLYVAERFIYTADPQAPPSYEFSHSVNFLGDTDRKVTMERLDYTVRNANGAASVNTRKKTLFDLTHRTLLEGASFHYQAEAKSRLAMGCLGIEQKRKGFSRKMGYRVCRATWGPDRKLAGGATLFTASMPSGAGSSEVSWEWSDAQDQLLAREITNDKMASLVITSEMTPEMRDALAAAWIMRLWWDLADGKFRRTMRRR